MTPGFPVTPEELRNRRDDLEAELRAIDAALAVSDCPGEGRCHGCLAWCDRCGDVKDVCDAVVCHKHRCLECGEIRLPETREHWSYVCEVCDPPTMTRDLVRRGRHHHLPDQVLASWFEISRHNEPQREPQEYDCGCVAVTRITDRDAHRDERPFEMRLAIECGSANCEARR